MTEVIYKYRLLLIIIMLVLTAFLIWMFFFRNDVSGLPSRGVFVLSQAA